MNGETRLAVGFHPRSLRTPVAVEITGRGGEGVTSTGTAGVVFVHPVTGEISGECAGPRPDGSCPATMAGFQVPCGGARIRGRINGSPRRFQFEVAPAATECPLRCLVRDEAHRAAEAFLGSAKEY